MTAASGDVTRCRAVHPGRPGFSWGAPVLACTLALAVGLTALADGASRKTATILCSPGAGHMLSKSQRVRVFASRGEFYSCWLPTRRRTTLGHVGELIPDKDAVLATHVRIDGEYVAFSEQAAGDPGFDLSTVVAVNARTGRVVRKVEPSEKENASFVDDVGVAADGTLVYLQAQGTPCPGERITPNGEPHPDDALIEIESGAKRQTLDCEVASEPESSISKLVVVGKTATWMHSGVLHTEILR